MVISWLAFGLAVGSLGWQIVSWRASGPRVKVRADTGYTGGPLGTGRFVAVTAANLGRAPTQVTAFGFMVPGEKNVLLSMDSYIKHVTMPAPLGAGEAADFWYDPTRLLEWCKQHGVALTDLRPYARTTHRLCKGT